jgi:hypothetical protein
MRPIHATEDSHVLIALAAASYVTRDVGCGAIVHSLAPSEPIDVDSALDRLALQELVRDVGRGRWRVTAQGWAVLNRQHVGACWETEVDEI